MEKPQEATCLHLPRAETINTDDNVQHISTPLGAQTHVFVLVQKDLYRQSCIPRLKAYNVLTFSGLERFDMMLKRFQVCQYRWMGKWNCISVPCRKPLTLNLPGGNTERYNHSHPATIV